VHIHLDNLGGDWRKIGTFALAKTANAITLLAAETIFNRVTAAVNIILTRLEAGVLGKSPEACLQPATAWATTIATTVATIFMVGN
jgi:hypothetical protein